MIKGGFLAKDLSFRLGRCERRVIEKLGVEQSEKSMLFVLWINRHWNRKACTLKERTAGVDTVVDVWRFIRTRLFIKPSANIVAIDTVAKVHILFGPAVGVIVF